MPTVRVRPAGWTIATIASSFAVVVALRVNALAGLALALAVLLFALVAFVPVSTTAGLLVVAAFITRFKVQIPGLGFRFEHFALALLLLACFLHARREVLRRMPTRPELAAIAFVVWAAVSSVANSPSIGKSLTIVGWYVMDVVILWLLVGLIQAGDVGWDDLARVGLWAGAVAGWLAAVLWLIALVHGGMFGVQYDYATGNIAAYGLSSEANILGSQSAL
ncbi:MAG: hypothetical protein JO054_17415, partial [Actinobacteria bacterium]|nr:hypothetical protein [Actinomycetota bacterium]